MSDHSVASDVQAKVLLEEMEKTIPQKIAVCAAHMMLEDGATVLDAGCADGVATAYFALTNPNIRVIGIDYDPSFISKAKHKYGHIPNLEFIEADLRSFDLGQTKLDAIMNLSILHEPYSFTGYRKKTVEEIIQAELANLKPGGVIINRDFVLPDNPDAMVYMALADNIDGAKRDTQQQLSIDDRQSPELLSYPQLLQLYAEEAMAFDNNDAQGHIKGFFLEEHTQAFDLAAHGIPQGWRVFYLPHGFAWEFIWRKEYRGRFYPEAHEKYAFWTGEEHRRQPQRLGARVIYHAHYENPWILKNWYQPAVILFDKNMQRLPLPPSNFLSVLQKINEQESFELREHKPSRSKARYLSLSTFRNTRSGFLYDLAARPGGDVLDVIAYSLRDKSLIIYAKYNYPRPMANTKPRMMSETLDRKTWSGHLIEAFATAAAADQWQSSVSDVLTNRAGFSAEVLPPTAQYTRGLTYYTSPSELNERVQSAFVRISKTTAHERKLSSQYSGFSNDGSVRSFSAQDLLDAAQVGMLAEARLELNVYHLLRELGHAPAQWIGEVPPDILSLDAKIADIDAAFEDCKNYQMFDEHSQALGWLDLIRSEFHEIAVLNERERVIARKELEFVVPSPVATKGLSTNCVSCLFLLKHASSEALLIGFEKISPTQSQFAAVQVREGVSGLLHIPRHRLPNTVSHIQQIPEYIAERYRVPIKAISKLGESYFPSLGIMPDRVFPYLICASSEEVESLCDFFPLSEAFEHMEKLQDLNSMIAIYRVAHALGIWERLQ